MKSLRWTCTATALLVLALVLQACSGDTGSQGPPGPSAVATNAQCLSASCHGSPSLSKTIVTAAGASETVPLYVDSAKFDNSVHKGLLCVSCHTDINGQSAHGPVAKIFGGWARFSAKQAVERVETNEICRTRNYTTAASMSCVTCHSNHASFMNSAHATIYKHREARIDVELSAFATAAEGKPITIGEDYTAGDCNRCHATCSTCHFKSTITRLGNGLPLAFWDNNQTSYPAPGFTDSMTEFKMDWTTNVASHEFRRGSYFANDTEGVCEACHTGFQKPAKRAYYWKAPGIADNVVATDVKRHPQTYELAVSGDNSYKSGGNNTAHAALTCAGCHGGSTGDVHALPGLSYLWSQKGDVQCTDCHNPALVHPPGTLAELHFDGVGIKVACIGCHTFGLARDFSGSGDDVFLDPVTNEVRPVVYKHGAAEAWYAHNWQRLDAGAGYLDNTSGCARKCHYSGNKIGASAW